MFEEGVKTHHQEDKQSADQPQRDPAAGMQRLADRLPLPHDHEPDQAGNAQTDDHVPGNQRALNDFFHIQHVRKLRLGEDFLSLESLQLAEVFNRLTIGQITNGIVRPLFAFAGLHAVWIRGEARAIILELREFRVHDQPNPSHQNDEGNEKRQNDDQDIVDFHRNSSN